MNDHPEYYSRFVSQHNLPARVRGQTGHVPRGPKLFGSPNFLVNCFKIVAWHCETKVQDNINVYGIHKKTSCNLSEYHSLRVSRWVTKLVNYVLLNYYLQKSSHSTLSLRTWEGPIALVSPGAPKSLVRPCLNHLTTRKFRGICKTYVILSQWLEETMSCLALRMNLPWNKSRVSYCYCSCPGFLEFLLIPLILSADRTYS